MQIPKKNNTIKSRDFPSGDSVMICRIQKNEKRHNDWPRTERPKRGQNSGPLLAPRSLWTTILIYINHKFNYFLSLINFSLHYIFCPGFVNFSVKLRPFVLFDFFIFGLTSHSALLFLTKHYIRPFYLWPLIL